MNGYTLAVLTHGDNRATLPQTLASFFRHVTPAPTCLIAVVDAYSDATILPSRHSFPLGNVILLDGHRGFCEATRELWHEAMRTWRPDHVFWLEHDYVIRRDVDMVALADILQARPDIAQVSLVRGPENDRERLAGGLIPSIFHALRGGWVEHRAYFTTNPCLMTTRFMRENPWPDYPAECVGRFGRDLVERGYSFAAFGEGDEWVSHVGSRDGKGY